MYIKRNDELTQAKDFVQNVQSKLDSSLIAEEVYENKMLTGWRIVPLRKGGR